MPQGGLLPQWHAQQSQAGSSTQQLAAQQTQGGLQPQQQSQVGSSTQQPAAQQP